jgi:arsenite methyltransferase
MLHGSRTPTSVRTDVSKTYATAAAPTDGVRLAGYDPSQIAALPEGAATEFFGCGNPLAYASVEPGQTVLDIGSGAGVDLILAARAVGEEGRVIGVDMTPSMVERARRNLAAAGIGNAEVREGIIEKLPVEDASVDWVISNCVISLSPEKDRVFQEIARVLKPGGRMLVSDIVVDEDLACVLGAVAPYVPSIGGARTEGHYLRAMLAAKLTDLEIRGRFVYEAEHLIGLFGDGVTGAMSDGCPITSVRARIGRSRLAGKAIEATARRVSGRVVSSKFYARKGEPAAAAP